MTNTLKTYPKNIDINFSSPFELKDTYSTTRIKVTGTKQMLNIDEKVKGALFLAGNLKEEVLKGTLVQKKKNIKQLKKILEQFVAISVMTGVSLSYGMITADPVLASANNLMVTTTTMNAANTPQITPDIIIDWAMQIALLVMAVGFGLSMSMFGIVGIYLMFSRKKKEVIEWNSDIIKGLVQVLVSIPLVYALFHIAQIVFKNLPFLEGIMQN